MYQSPKNTTHVVQLI